MSNSWDNFSAFAMKILDIVHRGTVLTLAGVTCWGVYTGINVHYRILEAGRRKPWRLLNDVD